MTGRMEVRIGRTALKNPVICGSGEHVMTEAGLRSAMASGVGMVIAKSFNESEAAKDQLDRTDYSLLDGDLNRLPWDFDPPRDATLASRSGLIRTPFAEWLETIVRLDREAAKDDVIVAPSIIMADLDASVDMARQVEQAGARMLEFNIGTPYGDEATGVVSTERATDRITQVVRAVCDAVGIPVWAKLTGQSENVAALADAARAGGADAAVLMGRFLGLIPDLDTQAPLLGTNLGIGGRWSLPMTCYWLAKSRKLIGPDYPLVGVNGIRGGDDAARLMLAGAHAVQLSTVVFTNGFDVLTETVDRLAAYLDRHGDDAADIVGRAADRVKPFTDLPRQPGFWETFAPPGAA